MHKKALIVSTSTLYGGDYLGYLFDELKKYFKDIKELLFIPYARPSGISYEDYTHKVSSFFNSLDIKVNGLHQYDDPFKAVLGAKAIFVGGGNTFVLVAKLHQLGLMPVIKEVVNNGCLYLGSSAGSNICGLTMQTTNDMPIVFPSSFLTLGLVPFNINPHYIDSEVNTRHMGEARETRIKEFHIFNTQPVIGLREGSWLEVDSYKITLRGSLTARIFEQNKPPYEIKPNSILDF